jgi:hypothetical protein
MRKILSIVLLLLAGAAFAGSGSISCLEDCCQKYGGTMDSHGCSIQQGDPSFQAYMTCSGYCVAGTELPSTGDREDITGPAPPTTTTAAPTTYEEPPSDEDAGCLPAFALLGILGLAGFVTIRK